MSNTIFIPKNLIDKVSENKVVIFVGSGFSKVCGYPDWHGLVSIFLEKMIEDDPKYKPFLELHKTSTMDILDILNQIKEEKKIIRDTIYNQFKFIGDNEDLENHRLLLKISKKIITTNYDPLLERAAGPTLQKVVYTNKHLVAKLSNSDSFIFKLHGDYEEADSCVLLREDYEKLYSIENSALEQFKNIITNNVVVFIGFSMSDPYVKFVFDYINKIYEGYEEKNYLITASNDAISHSNIQKVVLNSYDEIPQFLNELYDLALKKKTIPNIDVEMDEDEFKDFILDFHRKKNKINESLMINEVEIEEKYLKMKCSPTLIKEIDNYTSYFPCIDEIMMSPTYIDFDKKFIITSVVSSKYNYIHHLFGTGEMIFEETVNQIYSEYKGHLKINEIKLKYYIRILVAWTIFNCDIFNEDKREKAVL
ncbi:SIR2 family protein [Lysinibacillus xylanilyticus]|uniref:SIR2 family protein n=1 Tax=Lysinibacillus xylanilyticus TaxID=582475 RepID=A0ABV3W023_9BACI